MRVDLHYFRAKPGQEAIFLRLAPRLWERGITLRACRDAASPGRPDLRVIRVGGLGLEHPQGRTILDGAVPVILLERNDSVTTACHAEIKHPNVRRVIRIAVLPADLMNVSTERYHYHFLHGETPPPPAPVQILSPEEVAKIVPGPCYHAYDLMAPWHASPPPDLDTPRAIDAQFVGTIAYPTRPLITRHRTAFHDRLRGAPFRTFAGLNTLARADYYRLLRESRVVVSPYGHGEVCYRDAEAMYAGAVLVKPPADHALTWPPYFRAGITYVPCRADGEDLLEVVGGVLDGWDHYRAMRRANLERVRSCWDSDAIVDSCVRLLTLA